MLNELGLFAGIGGIQLGLKRAGLTKTVCYVENEPYCVEVLRARMRDGWLDTVPIWDDVTTFDGRPWRGCVDIISGGFPCTDISIAGKGAGIEGEKSRLWFDMLRIVREVRPGIVFVENVPGLLVRGADRVFGALAESGYDSVWASILARDVGAPHKRERVFIVAHSRLQRVQGFWARQIPQFPEFSWCKDVRRVENLRGRPDIPEPLIRRISDGVPCGVDRLRALGNAVVPQVAEYVGRRIRAWLFEGTDALTATVEEADI